MADAPHPPSLAAGYCGDAWIHNLVGADPDEDEQGDESLEVIVDQMLLGELASGGWRHGVDYTMGMAGCAL